MSQPTAQVRDATAATEFVQLLVGYKVIGCSQGEPVVVPCSREIRAHLVAALGGLYLLGVLLCGSLMWRLAHGEVPFMARRLRGIDVVIRLVVLIGLAGTVYGVVMGTSGMGAAADGGSDAAVRVVGTMGQALGIGFTANLFSILAASALMVSRHFVGNAAAYLVAEHG